MAEPAAKKARAEQAERHKTERALGSAPLRTTCLGLGGASLGDLFLKIPSAQALDTVTRSAELGLKYFDTAPRSVCPPSSPPHPSQVLPPPPTHTQLSGHTRI